MNYINTEIAIELHDFIIEQTGGLSGVRDFDLLDSPILAIQDDKFYPDFAHKLAFLMFSIVNNHPFIDGNKRTAVAVCSAFLKANNYSEKEISMFMSLAQFIVVNIAMSKISLEELGNVLVNWLNKIK